jgi:hypothetical protein
MPVPPLLSHRKNPPASGPLTEPWMDCFPFPVHVANPFILPQRSRVVDVANCLTSILRQQTRGFEFSVPIHHKIQRSKRTLSTAMMMKACVIVLLSLLPLAVVQGFAPPQLQRSSTQLAASTQPFQKLAGAFLATTTILSNVVWFAPPQPADAASFFEPPVVVVAPVVGPHRVCRRRRRPAATHDHHRRRHRRG